MECTGIEDRCPSIASLRRAEAGTRLTYACNRQRKAIEDDAGTRSNSKTLVEYICYTSICHSTVEFWHVTFGPQIVLSLSGRRCIAIVMLLCIPNGREIARPCTLMEPFLAACRAIKVSLHRCREYIKPTTAIYTLLLCFGRLIERFSMRSLTYLCCMM